MFRCWPIVLSGSQKVALGLNVKSHLQIPLFNPITQERIVTKWCPNSLKGFGKTIIKGNLLMNATEMKRQWNIRGIFFSITLYL
jgi:hypothetical protein